MILGECRRYLRDNNAIRVSRSVRDLAYRALGVKEKLAAQYDGEPTIEAIAKELGEKLSDVSSHWKPSQSRCHCTKPYTATAEIPSVSWISCAMKLAVTRCGWKISR